MTDPTLTQRLTELITTKPIAPTDLEHAALLVLDAIANALAGRASEPGAILLRWAETAAPTDAARRAFLLGALTHILETDDLHRASVVHPGCVVIPAAWAVAAREGIRGHAMLRAVLWGFEAATRVGMAVGPSHYRLWHNTAPAAPTARPWRRRHCCISMRRRRFTRWATPAHSRPDSGNSWKRGR